MDLQKIIDKIKKEGGCNIDCNLVLKDLKSGYMVSLEQHELKIKIHNGFFNSVIVYDAILKQQQKIKTFKNPSNYYIGFWINDGELYIDISKNIQTFYNAFNEGIKNNQFYIYDLKNKRDIAIEKNVYIVYAYDKIKNDFRYLKECGNIKELQSFLNISHAQIYNILKNDIDAINASDLYLNKYAIIKDKAFYKDLQ